MGVYRTATFTPENTFEVIENTATGVPMVQLRQLGTGDASVRFRTASPAKNWAIGIDVSNAGGAFVISESTGLGSLDRLTILNGSGNVGIGTSNPQAKLDVNGNVWMRSNVIMSALSGNGSAKACINQNGSLCRNGAESCVC